MELTTMSTPEVRALREHEAPKPRRWYSDADLDETVIDPKEPVPEFGRRILTEFASRWNVPFDADQVHLGFSRKRAHDDFEVFGIARGMLRRLHAERKAEHAKRQAEPVAPEPEDYEYSPDQIEDGVLERTTLRLRVLSDLDIEESALATDWSMPEIENRWDTVTIGGRAHMAAFEDMLDQMTPVDHDNPLDDATIAGLERRFGEHLVTEGEYAERLCRYAWDDGYFERKRVPWFRCVGRVHTGGFATWPNGDRFAACVVKRLVPNAAGTFNTRYTVFWREHTGTSTKVTEWGRKVATWDWYYGARKDFEGRTSAVAFATRLTALAKTEAALERDAWASAPGAPAATPAWWQDEAPWDPGVLAERVGGVDHGGGDGTPAS
jgi:hypothetical protein